MDRIWVGDKDMEARDYTHSVIFDTMSVNKHNGFYDLVLLAATVFFSICYWRHALWGTNLALMIIFFICLFVQLKEKNYGTFFFYLTFFLFLLDTIFFGLFDSSYKYEFDEDIEYHALLCLAISIIGVYVGSILGRQYRRRDEPMINIGNPMEKKQKQGIPRVSDQMRSFLRSASICCILFSIIEAFVKARYVQANSYLAYYSDYTTPLPYFMVWISSVSPLFLYLYLGTFPKKKEAMLPVVLFLMVGITALFYGQRNVFVTYSLVVFCYFLIRNKYSDEEVWLSRKEIILLVALLPIGILFMAFWDSVRFEQDYERSNFIQNIINGLLEQGNDISIVDFEYKYRKMLPDRPFAIGGIISSLHNNVIAQMLGIQQIPTKANTIETALDGYAFSCSLMYIQNEPRYLMGYGIGSCFIAELVFSFGYTGIAIGSFVYGVVLRKLCEGNIKGFIYNGICLLIFQMLLLAPRASYDGFISSIIQVSTLFILLLCYILNKYVWPEIVNG